MGVLNLLCPVSMRFPYKNDEKTRFSAFKQKNKVATPQVMHGKSLKYKNKHFFYLPEKISDSL